MRPIASTPEVDTLLADGCAVAVGVSGGKDSVACALATARHLDSIGHRGPRLLVHADLGRVEWQDSLPACERVAARIGWELVTVERAAGDMLDRWETRWRNNVSRYADLSCVRLILPWSTPQMRFCTSELKVAPITSALKRRFPNLAIINASGIRREESPTRARMPVAGPLQKLQRKGLAGIGWNPIIDWSVSDVWSSLHEAGLRPHDAYTRWGASRVSCAYCIMSSERDLLAAAGCADNHDLYRAMVNLEARSTFAFQGARWLADVAPTLLDDALAARVNRAKEAARLRQAAEARLPASLLYTGGWPTCVPSPTEAALIAGVRREVADAVGIEGMRCLNAGDVMERYQVLIAAAEGRGSRSVTPMASRATRKQGPFLGLF